MEKAGTKEQKQKILNELFPLDRRERMIASASEDKRGRKVRYYRYIKFPKFLEILKNGKQSAADYSNPNEIADKKLFKDFLVDFWSFGQELRHPETDLEDLFREEDNLRKEDLREVMNAVFPAVSQEEKDRVVANPTNENILVFIERYVDEGYIKRRHTGSVMQRFSPFLSMSVGGVINDSVLEHDDYVYIETVIADEKIILHPETDQGEKEVLVREIKKEDVSRVFIDFNQLKREVLGDKTSAIGDFISKNKISPYRGGLVEQWRWDEKTSDCLPKSLL